MSGRRQVKIGFSMWPTGRHASAWRLPEAYLHGTVERDFMARAVRTAERGKLDYFFIGSINHSEPWLQHVRHNNLFKAEPFTLASFAAAVTENIGLVVTVNSTYSDPFTVARSAATLDHLSNGRLALNIVTGAAGSGSFAAGNFGRDRHPGTDERYDIAEELIVSVQGLWDSWEDDWMIGDKAGGRFLDIDKVHRVDFRGRYFSVDGPLNVPRPPQGQLPIFHAGTSERSNDFGARYADVRFTSFEDRARNKAYYEDIKGRLASYGRRREDQFLIPGITFYVGETSAEAHAKFRQVQDLSVHPFVVEQISNQLGLDLGDVSPDERVASVVDLGKIPKRAWVVESAIAAFGDEGITLRDLFHFLGNIPFGQPPVVGSGKEVADWIEEQFEDGTLDGVMMFPPYMPDPLDAFVDHVVPELQRRGLFRKDYESSTFRGHFGLPRPANRYAGRQRVVEEQY